jgi:hypothetical protein
MHGVVAIAADRTVQTIDVREKTSRSCHSARLLSDSIGGAECAVAAIDCSQDGRQIAYILLPQSFCNSRAGTSHAGALTALSVLCRFILWEMPEIALAMLLQLIRYIFKKTPILFGRLQRTSRLDPFVFPLVVLTKRCSRTDVVCPA